MKILAIDIGTAQVKTIIVESKFKRHDIIFHETIPVRDFLEPINISESMLSQGQLEALSIVKNRHSHGIDRIVINLPHSLYNSRLMSFPFKDKKKINSAIQFAVEDEIPFNIEDCIISSNIYPSEGRDTKVLVGIANASILETFFNFLKTIALEPDELTSEHAAFSSILMRQKNFSANKGVAIINIGHRKSNLQIYRDGLPFLQRTSMMGGYQITQAISNTYKIPIEQAEAVKVEKGFFPLPGMQLDKNQKVFSDLIIKTLDPLLRDLDLAFMAYSTKTHDRVNHIYLTGGSSLFPGLSNFLSERWGQPVTEMRSSTSFPGISINPDRQQDLIITSAIAIGLSKTSGDGKNTLNFRTGKFRSVKSNAPFQWQQYQHPIKLAFIVYLFAVISMFGQSFFLSKELITQDKKFERAIQDIFGRTSSSYLASLKSNPQKIQQGVNKKLEELNSQLGTSSGSNFSPLDIMDALSKAIPQSAPIEIKEMQLTSTMLNLKLESPSQPDAEKAIKSIQNIPQLGPVQTGTFEQLSTGRKRVSINMKVIPVTDGT